MRRRFLACLSVASLVLCFAITAAWVRYAAYRTGTVIGIGRGRTAVEFNIDERFRFSFWRYDRPLAATRTDASFLRDHMLGWFVGNVRETGIEGMGFAIAKVEFDGEFHPVVVMTERYVQCPIWFILLLTGPVPMIWAAMRLWMRIPPKGLCPHCGYDLRATPRRCPECGSPAPPKPEGAA